VAVVKAEISSAITGHAQVRAALRDTATYSSDLQGDADVRSYRQLPLEVDPPLHHIYRSALSKFFIRPTVEAFVPNFRENARNLLTQYFQSSGRDFIEAVALPLVLRNLGLLYSRPQDVAEWISWGDDVWTAGGQGRDGATLHQYLDRVFHEAKSAGGASGMADIWSQIVALKIDERELSEIEFKGIASVMLAGGRDTVIKMISGIGWALSARADLLNELRDDATLIPGAIAEFLRYFTPLPAMARTTTPESSGVPLPDDRYVEISFLSANFDEQIFENPFEIDIHRVKNAHLSFGFGPHSCLGSHLAEFEIAAFLQEFLGLEMEFELRELEVDFHEGELKSVPKKFHRLEIGPADN
jgi:cytochrome P450